MRKAFCVLSLVVFVSSAAFAADMPKRKPGLWEIRTSMEGGPAGPAIKQCIDASTDDLMQQSAAQMAPACTKQDMRKEGDAYFLDSDCKMGQTRVQSTGVFRGDFSSNYEGEISATYTPPMMGMPSGKTKISARWLGPCQPDQRPGDMIMPNGMKMNLDMLKQMGKGGGR